MITTTGCNFKMLLLWATLFQSAWCTMCPNSIEENIEAINAYGRFVDYLPLWEKTVTCSSQYRDDYKCENIADGFQSTTGHTLTTGPGQYFEIDLEDIYTVTGFKIFNRVDCCGERIADFRINFLGVDGSVVKSYNYKEWGEILTVYVKDYIKLPSIRYARIELDTDQHLAIGEVKISAYLDSSPVSPILYNVRGLQAALYSASFPSGISEKGLSTKVNFYEYNYINGFSFFVHQNGYHEPYNGEIAIVWTGSVVAPCTANYFFSTDGLSDAYFKLEINGIAKTDNESWIKLTANTLYTIKLTYYHHAQTNGQINLYWQIQGGWTQNFRIPIQTRYIVPSVQSNPEIFVWPSYIDFDSDKLTEVIKVRLSEQPTSSVTVTPKNVAGAEVYSFEFCNLVFTPENWNVEQTIRVKKNTQFPTLRDGVVTVPFTSSSSDQAWFNITSPLQINSVAKEFIPAPRVCTGYGDVHYQPFDGTTRIDFQGFGTYHKARTCDGKFDLQTTNTPCGDENANSYWQAVSCQRRAFIRYGSTVYAVYISNKKLAVGLLEMGDNEVQITVYTNQKVAFKTPSGITITITYNTIHWIDPYLNVVTSIPGGHTHIMRGLCGNNDGNFANDNLSSEELEQWKVASAYRLDNANWKPLPALDCNVPETPPGIGVGPPSELDLFIPEQCYEPEVVVPPVDIDSLPVENQPNPDVVPFEPDPQLEAQYVSECQKLAELYEPCVLDDATKQTIIQGCAFDATVFIGEFRPLDSVDIGLVDPLKELCEREEKLDAAKACAACTGEQVCTYDGQCVAASTPCAPGCSNGGVCNADNVCECTDPSTFGIHCQQKDECRVDPCLENSICISNSDGAATCHCQDGFTGDGDTCTTYSECDSRDHPCKNDSVCNKVGADYECSCQPGYTGKNCDLETECSKQPCENEGACLDKSDGSYECQCKDGYSGNNCESYSACDLNTPPCENGSKCNKLGDGYECDCLTGYKGKNCDEETACKSEPCQNDGVCTNNLDGTYKCSCTDGYSGGTCADYSACDLDVSPCKNDSTCQKVDDDYACSCMEGFEGKNCDQDTPCKSNPCKNNGVCTNGPEGSGSYSCGCTDGFFGPTCEEYNACDAAVNSCENGSVCSTTANGYECACKDGFTGQNCDQETPCKSNPCKNQSTCTDDPGMTTFTCQCKDGYSGDTCELFNSCDLNTPPCENESECIKKGEDYECTCSAGYQGKNCNEETPCNSQPCKNSGTCQNNPDGATFKCNCAEGYSGETCIEFNACNVGDGPCENNSECQKTSNADGYECSCLEGYQGKTCGEETPCKSEPCQNNGQCTNNPDGSYKCSCADGFSGETCASYNACDLAIPPCKNGSTCQKADNADGYECLCLFGYKGKNCDEETACKSRPCNNNGVCNDSLDGDYTCSCTNGYSGKTCAEYDACIAEDNPCLNGGSCNKAGIGYTCTCPKGYQGKYCETESGCNVEPCKNNGVCADGPLGTYTCNCVDNYTGDTCQKELPCKSEPCKNNGVCSNGPDETYTCECKEGFLGENCENEPPCKSSPCNNSGVCTDGPDGSYTCACKEGYLGENCENEPPCKSSPCKNSGVCTDGPDGSYTCACKDGYLGENCENEPPCKSSPCKNNGVCADGPDGSYSCACQDGYLGENCENEPPCKSSPCKNNGVCSDGPDGSYSCTCKDGYIGNNCQQVQSSKECKPLENPCQMNPCENQGECTLANDADGGYTCACVGNFLGPNCKDSNPCASNPCPQGETCNRISNSEHQCSAAYCASKAGDVEAWCSAYTAWGAQMCSMLTGGLCEFRSAKPGSEAPLSPKVYYNVDDCVSSESSNSPIPYQGAYCDGPEGLIILTDTAVRIMSSTGEVTTCQSGLFDLVAAARGDDGELYVVSDMGQNVERISKDCTRRTPLLTMMDGLIRPSSVAYKPLGGGKYSLAVSNTQGAIAGHVFTFDDPDSTTPSSIEQLGSGPKGLYHLHYDGDGKLFGVSDKRQIGTFAPGSYTWSAYPFIPAIVDMRNIGTCDGKMYIAADDNNDIFRCSDPANPSTCVRLCVDGLTNPWAIGIGTDCSVYSASRGPGAGRIVKLSPDQCFSTKEIGQINNGGDGIKTIIPFGEATSDTSICPGSPTEEISCSLSPTCAQKRRRRRDLRNLRKLRKQRILNQN